MSVKQILILCDRDCNFGVSVNYLDDFEILSTESAKERTSSE